MLKELIVRLELVFFDTWRTADDKVIMSLERSCWDIDYTAFYLQTCLLIGTSPDASLLVFTRGSYTCLLSCTLEFMQMSNTLNLNVLSSLLSLCFLPGVRFWSSKSGKCLLVGTEGELCQPGTWCLTSSLLCPSSTEGQHQSCCFCSAVWWSAPMQTVSTTLEL